ncbi:MAG: def2 [Burkholderiales bacterium]|jgi:peptide deformylase|nr:def2 [Burkholderiales bacterium]
MIKEIVTVGNKILHQRSIEVAQEELNTPELNAIIQDMIDTKNSIVSAVGIAAVQIGVLKRIAIIGFGESNPRYADIGSCSQTVLINPSYEVVGEEVYELNEGCLSVPEKRGVVTRPKRLKYKYQDQTGAVISGETDNFFARVLQHEVDHMDGILFPMRIERMENNKTI